MAKFFVTQNTDYLMGRLRYGHREGYIEAESEEAVLNKLEEEEYVDGLHFVLDEYSVDDCSYEGMKFKIKKVEE